MGFWDTQIEELRTGIGVLIGGPAPLSPGTTDPSPPPLPPVLPGQPLPQYPPYIPENQVDLSHLPESSIAGVHGDYSVKPDEDVVLWPPPPSGIGDAAGTAGPGNLPPYWLKDYREIAPGVWVRDDRPEAPGQVHPAGMSNWTGQGADAAKKQAAAIAAARKTRDEADQGLGDAVNDTQTAAHRTQERLRRIQAEVDAGVRALQPTLDTPAAQQQMASFLAAKARETQAVMAQAQQASASSATALSGVRSRYSAIV